MYLFDHEIVADEMLTDFNSVCNLLDIPWWVVAGTALGFYRGGGYIPWDTDIDVGIICTDDEYTEIFKILCNSYGFTKFYDVSEGKKFRCGIGHVYKGGRTPRDSILLDIWRIGVEYVSSIAPKFFEVITWFKYKKIYVRIPYPIEDYLIFAYGNTWRIQKPQPKHWKDFITQLTSQIEGNLNGQCYIDNMGRS